MAAGDRIFLGGNTTITNNGGDLHSGEINEGGVFALTADTVYPTPINTGIQRTSFTCSRECRYFTVVNRGRDLSINSIVLDLPTSTTVGSTSDPATFDLDLNDIKYTFYSTESAGVIHWNWQTTEHREVS